MEHGIAWSSLPKTSTVVPKSLYLALFVPLPQPKALITGGDCQFNTTRTANRLCEEK
jgi:hypothetical protein